MSVLKAACPFLLILLAGCERGPDRAEATASPPGATTVARPAEAHHHAPPPETPSAVAPAQAPAGEKPAPEPVAVAERPRGPSPRPAARPTVPAAPAAPAAPAEDHAGHDHAGHDHAGHGHAEPAPAGEGADTGTSNPPEVAYTCPMHPDVKSKAPGRCPECGMDLVPRKP